MYSGTVTSVGSRTGKIPQNQTQFLDRISCINSLKNIFYFSHRAEEAHNDEEQISEEFEDIDVVQNDNISQELNFDKDNKTPSPDPSTECTRYQNMIPGIRVEKGTDNEYSFSLGKHVKDQFVTLEQSKSSESDDCVVLSPPHSSKPTPSGHTEPPEPPQPESISAEPPESEAAKPGMRPSLMSLYSLPKPDPDTKPPSAYDVTRAIICYIGGPFKLPNAIWNNPLRKVTISTNIYS